MTTVSNKQKIRENFETDGYVLVEDVLDPHKVLDPIISEYENVLDDLCRELYKQKEIKSLHEDLEFDERIIQIYIITACSVILIIKSPGAGVLKAIMCP